MQTRKILAILTCIVLLTVFAVPVFAETSTPETSEEWATNVLETISSYERGDVNIIYTDDSVVWSGIYTDASIDVLSKQLLFVIDVDLPAGYEVYDNPDTEIIDGIRLNGQTVTSYRVPIDYTKDTDFELVVRTVYSEGFLGTLAQMSDGTYDWIKLLENPIGILMALYYILAILSVVAGLFALVRGKGKKIKTANDIAEAVQKTSHETAMQTIEQKVLPIAVSFQNTAQLLVKAYALSTSKSKEAPVALLDTLQEVSNLDVAALIEQLKTEVTQQQEQHDIAIQETKQKLSNIANAIQEVESNGTEQIPEEEVAIF